MSADVDDVRCQEVVEVLTHYLDGVLDARVLAQIERHLAGCRGCLNYVEQLRITISLLGRTAPQERAGAASDALLAAFRDWQAGRPPP